MPNPPLLEGLSISGENVAPDQSLIDFGYTSTNAIPLAKNVNFMMNQFYSYLNYLKRTGRSVWEDDILYFENDRTISPVDFREYKAFADNQDKEPSANPNYWEDVLLSLIKDNTTTTDRAWSSYKINNKITALINDSVVSTTSGWSSHKVEDEAYRFSYSCMGIFENGGILKIINNPHSVLRVTSITSQGRATRLHGSGFQEGNTVVTWASRDIGSQRNYTYHITSSYVDLTASDDSIRNGCYMLTDMRDLAKIS